MSRDIGFANGDHIYMLLLQEYYVTQGTTQMEVYNR
jgi:hypothetical protein